VEKVADKPWFVHRSIGDEQLPVISYFSHRTSMRDRQVLYAKKPNWATYKTA
jgi:hypothetical protein